MENGPFIDGLPGFTFTYEKWWFSMAMLNYQRVDEFFCAVDAGQSTMARPDFLWRGVSDLLTSPCRWWCSYTYGYGSIPIHTIFRGMNIHLPAILMFTRGTRFWHTAILTSNFLGTHQHHSTKITWYWVKESAGIINPKQHQRPGKIATAKQLALAETGKQREVVASKWQAASFYQQQHH